MLFENFNVNTSIPSETFTAANLGMQNGDKFIDKVNDKEFTYQNDELVEVVKENP